MITNNIIVICRTRGVKVISEQLSTQFPSNIWSYPKTCSMKAQNVQRVAKMVGIDMIQLEHNRYSQSTACGEVKEYHNP